MTDTSEKQNRRYPFGKHHRQEIRTQTGKLIPDLSLSSVLNGEMRPEDLSVCRSTLEDHGSVAEAAGYAQVAENLRRAAEMTNIPNDEILEIYEVLRPGRSTYYQLLSLSQRLSSLYDAELTGAYIRDAAEAYRDTGLLKMDEE